MAPLKLPEGDEFERAPPSYFGAVACAITVLICLFTALISWFIDWLLMPKLAVFPW